MQCSGPLPPFSNTIPAVQRSDNLRADDIASRGIEAQAKAKKSKDRPVLNAVITITPLFSAGMLVQQGMERLQSGKVIMGGLDVLIGLACLVTWSITYIMQRKVKTTEGTNSTGPTGE